LAHLPDTELLIIGEGPDRRRFEALAHAVNVASRVRFVGGVPQEDLARYYSAADALVLASEREGWPNVLLESLACGTPVVASEVGGAGEIVRAPEAGTLVAQRNAAAFAGALERLFAHPPDRAATRRYAERFGWDETTSAQTALYRRVIGAN